MEQRELIKRMRGRIDHCRRLALQTIDPHTADALIQMANEGEEDVQRLLAGTSAKLPQIGAEWSATLTEASVHSALPEPPSVGTKV